MKQRTPVWIASLALGGLLVGCGTHPTAPVHNTAMDNTVATTFTNATEPSSQPLNVEQTHQLYGSTNNTSKTKSVAVKKKSSKVTTTKSSTTTTTSKPSSSGTKTSTTTVKTSTPSTPTTTTSKPSSSSSTTTKTSTPSSGTSNSGGSSSPAPQPTNIVTQYVSLAFQNPSGETNPWASTTVKMEYNKATGVLEAWAPGVSDTTDFWFDFGAGKAGLQYSMNYGSTWLSDKWGAYSGQSGVDGVSNPPKQIIVKTSGNTLYFTENAWLKSGGNTMLNSYGVTYNGSGFVTKLEYH